MVAHGCSMGVERLGGEHYGAGHEPADCPAGPGDSAFRQRCAYAHLPCDHRPQAVTGRCATVGCSERATDRITWVDSATGERVPELVCAPCADAYERRPALRVVRGDFGVMYVPAPTVQP